MIYSDILRNFFLTGQTRPLEFRKKQLTNLKNSIIKHENNLYDALLKDLNKSPYESYLTEISLTLREIDIMIANLSKWAAHRKVSAPITFFPAKSYIIPEPMGAVIIISPWNYPVMLTLMPLAGAIAAGNCALVKPSEFSPSVSMVLQTIIDEAFEAQGVMCTHGGVEHSAELLEMTWDYIFFTGSARVGKLVMASASKNLTPVTLELGGKSPVIVHKDADISMAARRIAWGKIINSGQTCVAPDYAFFHASIADRMVDELKKAFDEMVSADGLPKIITDKHFARTSAYMDGVKIVYGGQTDAATRTMHPTILDSPSPDSPVMQDEIFAPILPFYRYENIDEPVKFIRSRPKPLALYLFTSDSSIENTVTTQLSYGGGCINDVLMHVGHHHLPFGGVGYSGMGAYHGKYSFETFSHMKGILKRPAGKLAGILGRLESSLRFPPYRNRSLDKLKKLM